jgi:hypothetical protein
LDGSDVHSTTFFAWSESVDPDGHAVTYRIDVAEDDAFSVGLISRDGILGTSILLSQEDGLMDGRSYFWRVVPIDEFGASSAANEIRSFSVDNTNDLTPNSIFGVVLDANSGDTIAGASIALNPGGLSTTTGQGGFYVFVGIPDGFYSVRATSSGHFNKLIDNQPLFNGETREIIFRLVPNDLPPSEGEGPPPTYGALWIDGAPISGGVGDLTLLTLVVGAMLFHRRGRVMPGLSK